MLSYKKTEAILYRYKYMETELQMLDLEIDKANRDMGNIREISYDDMPHATGPSNPVENEILNKERELLDLQYRKETLELQKKMIDITVESLDKDLKDIFNAVYKTVGRCRRSDICRRLNISKDKFHRDKKELVYTFARVL